MKTKKKRKVHTMLVTVTANGNLTAAQVRREVRWNIKDQCSYMDVDNEGNDIRISVKGIKGYRA